MTSAARKQQFPSQNKFKNFKEHLKNTQWWLNGPKHLVVLPSFKGNILAIQKTAYLFIKGIPIVCWQQGLITWLWWYNELQCYLIMTYFQRNFRHHLIHLFQFSHVGWQSVAGCTSKLRKKKVYFLFACTTMLVGALCCRMEGGVFETWWGNWMLSIYLILLATLDPGVYSSSNKNEYQGQK
jgi:hypothetical protein